MPRGKLQISVEEAMFIQSPEGVVLLKLSAEAREREAESRRSEQGPLSGFSSGKPLEGFSQQREKLVLSFEKLSLAAG